MISPRFVPILCVLTLFPLVPTWIHSYAQAVEDDGLTTTAISSTLSTFRGTATNRSETWGGRRFDSADWIERTYTDGVHSVRLTVVRTYDPKSVYHHPELAVADGTSFAPVTIERLAERPDVPIHVLRSRGGRAVVSLYVLRYEDRFVADAIPFQIRTSGELLFTPRKAMTLFFTTESDVPDEPALDTLNSANVLLSAIDAFVAQTPSSSDIE